MIFDFINYIEELKNNSEKKEGIEKFEILHGKIIGKVEDQIWYKNYASLFSLYYKPFKVPEELIEDFDYKLFFNLCCSSFSSNPRFVAPNKINYSENDELELEITVENNGKSVTKKVSELWGFQILRLFEIYCEEQINLQTLYSEPDLNETISILQERGKRFTNIQNLGIKTISEDEANEQKEELIYHYTTLENAIGILSSKKLWASDYQCLNDRKEIVIGFEVFDKVLDYVKKMEDFEKYENDLIELSKNVNKNKELELFIVSFSYDGDLLSQWRAYGDNGQGICIGFNKKDLLKLIYENKKVNEDILNGELDYDYKKVYEETFEILRNFAKEIEVYNLKNNDKSELVEKVSNQVWYNIASLKDPSFFEEKEFRLFYSQYCSERTNEIKFRNMVIPYVEIDYSAKESPIKTIKIGPTNNDSVLTTKKIKLLLEKLGIVTEITTSDIPYKI